jgi:hypothetical protein
MIEADSSRVRILQKSLNGERAVDEQTFASLEILSERLEVLKKLDEVFEKVGFSPVVERLKAQRSAVVVR